MGGQAVSHELFIPRKFGPKHEALIVTAERVMSNYAQQGYDLSLRQLYYQFVARHGLPNTEQNYKMLGTVISDARLAGRLDWDTLVDRGRETIENPHWDDPADFLESVSRQYRFDLWDDQPSSACFSVLEPVCRRLDVPFSANKGYSSSSHLYQVGQRLKDALESDKKVVILYLGDHDPSGIDMSRDVEDRLMLFSEWGSWDEDAKRVQPWNDDETVFDSDAFTLVRVALNMDQVEAYDPPPNPTKLTDSRANGYIAKFGMECWELDALDPETLANLVTAHVADWTDAEKMEAAKAKMATERAELVAMATKYREDNS